VTGIGLGALDGLAKFRAIGVGLLILLVSPPPDRVAEELLIPVHTRLTQFGPQTARPSERRDAALGRQPRSDKGHYVTGLNQQLCRFVQCSF
jgi:hypothetical protein